MNLEIIIGLEVYVELKINLKIFFVSLIEFGVELNI